MAGGVPISFLLGGLAVYARLWYGWRSGMRFKVPQPGVRPRLIHHFRSDYAVEVAARVGRVFDEDGITDPTALDIAENVLKVCCACCANCSAHPKWAHVQPVTAVWLRFSTAASLLPHRCHCWAQAGVQMMPDSPYLRLVLSSFQIEVRHNNQASWIQLEAARKMDLNLSFQFSIFTREQVCRVC